MGDNNRTGRKQRPFVEEIPATLLVFAGQIGAEVVISAVVAISETIYYRAQWRVEVRALEGVLGAGEGRTLLEAGLAALASWLPRKPPGRPV